MKVLYIGYAVSRKEALHLVGISTAGNNMQLHVLEQLSHYSDMDLKSLTIYPTAAYPKGKLIIHRKKIRLFGNFTSVRAGFLNIPVIKQVNQTISIYKEARRIILSDKIKTILTFNLYPQTGLAAKWLKKRYNCELISLLADLPIDDRVGKKSLGYLLLRKCFDRITLSLFSHYDRFITLNKHAVERFAPHKEYIVMEGGVDPAVITESSQLKGKGCGERKLVYSGALEDYSGILDLINAMRFVTAKGVKLDIYGKGHLEEYIRKFVAKLTNVEYHGSISHDAMMKIQEEAYLLVNPRPVEHPIAQVTFPSKLLEYMLSGTPVLTTKLNGLSEEYLDKMFFFENDTSNVPRSMAKRIDEIIGLPLEDLQDKGVRARRFLLEEKNWSKQGEKIYQFMKAGYHEGRETVKSK